MLWKLRILLGIRPLHSKRERNLQTYYSGEKNAICKLHKNMDTHKEGKKEIDR